MRRKVTTKLSEWKSRHDRLPLIVTGCRQIGKTYSVKEFVKSNYRSHIYINFETNPDKKTIFDGTLEHADLISKIILSEGVKLYEGDSAIVLDEIQDCPNAYSALKSLSYDRRYDVICMGSFLGVNLDDDDGRISPMGYVDMITMHPMDFEEYLWAIGVKDELVDEIRRCIRAHESIPEYFNKVFLEHFRRYVVIGGMPAAVKVFSTTQDYVRTSEVLDGIIAVLKKDAGRYSRKAGRVKINACLESIPIQLSKEDKRFHYKDVEKKKNAGHRTYGNSLEWLEESGLIIRCNNLHEPVMPLSERRILDFFKIYMADTGILMRLMKDVDPVTFVLRDPFTNYGAVMENAVAMALSIKGYAVSFYSKRDSTLEVDFVIGMAGKVVFIEVKSGRNKRSKSLNTLMNQYARDRIGLKVMESNVELDDNGVLHLPLYAPCFFDDNLSSPIPPASSSVDEINRMFDEYRGAS